MFDVLPSKAGEACILKKIPNVEISYAKIIHHGQRPCPTLPGQRCQRRGRWSIVGNRFTARTGITFLWVVWTVFLLVSFLKNSNLGVFLARPPLTLPIMPAGGSDHPPVCTVVRTLCPVKVNIYWFKVHAPAGKKFIMGGLAEGQNRTIVFWTKLNSCQALLWLSAHSRCVRYCNFQANQTNHRYP